MQKDESRFSDELMNELKKIGIDCQSEFAVPLKGTDRFHTIDCFIQSPYRAIVEIYLQPTSQNNKIVNQLTKHLKTLIETFDESVTFFFLTPESTVADDNHQLNKALNDVQLEFEPNFFMLPLPSEDEKNPAKVMAKVIKNSITLFGIHPNGNESEGVLYNYAPGTTEQFSDVLISIKPFLKPKEFEILEEEFAELHEEYDSEHFTSSALRAGRTLEFAIYTLCRAWKVPINYSTSKKLNDLDNTYKTLKKKVVDFSYSTEPEKSKKKNEIKSIGKDLQNKLIDLYLEIDNLEKPEEQKDVPINIQALLRDIKKKYGKSSKIRDSLDFLLKENDLIDKTFKMRNVAAHARTSGKRETITRFQVDQMMEDVRFILFNLVNLAVKIQEEEKQKDPTSK